MNGALVDATDASVSVFDHGLLTGDGVFESIVIRHGALFALSRHLDRLFQSADRLGIAPPPVALLERWAREVAASSGFASGKVRITVTGGRGVLGSARSDGEPFVIIAAEEAAPSRGPVRLVVAPWPKNERGPLAGAKTISYAENVVAFAHAKASGADEAIWINTAGDVCEGTGTNIFLGIGGRLVTPSLTSGCLAGVTRGLVLELVGCEERAVAGGELGEVEEAFLTSTTRGVQPVTAIGDRELPSCPGPLTEAARDAFDTLAARGVD